MKDSIKIVMARKAGPYIQKASAEICRYVRLQSGVTPSTGWLDEGDIADGTIVLSTVKGDPTLLARLGCGGDESPEHGKDDFLVKHVDVNGKSVMLVVGGNEVAVLYGAYALLEEMGWVFQISKDVLPQKTSGVPWPSVNKHCQSRAKQRGILWTTFQPDHIVCGLEDYAKLFDQMVKLRMNTFIWWHINNYPWLDFKWKGERPVLGDNGHPDAAFCLWRGCAGSYRTDDLPVGSQHFPASRMVPLELADCVTEEEFLEKGRWFLSSIFDLAVERGLEPVFCLDPRTAATNHGRLLGGQPEGSFAGYVGTYVPANHPDLAEFNRVRIRAIMASYPQVRRLCFNLSEHAVTAKSPEEIAFYERLKKESGLAWDKAVKAYRLSWGRGGGSSKEEYMQSSLGWIHAMRDIVPFCEKEYPDVTLMGLGINRIEALHLMDVMLPKGVQFSDMQGSCVWAPYYWGAHLPLELYGDVPQRRTTLITPRLDDDAHGTGINFHVRQYIEDGFFDGCSRIGMTGMIVQTNRPRGHEHNMRFLMETLWECGLTEETFYRRYCQRLFGVASEKMQEAYKTLEDENERERKLLLANYDARYAEPGWAFGIRAFVNQPNLVNGPLSPVNQKNWDEFMHMTRHLQALYAKGLPAHDRAAALFREALRVAPKGSKQEIRYLLNRVEVYREWTACLVDCLPFAKRYKEGFRLKKNGDWKGFKDALTACRRQVEELLARQQALTEKFSEIIEAPNDRGLLFSLNRLGLAVFGEFACAVRHVDDFHHGRAYWQHRPNWRKVNDGGEWCAVYKYPLDYPNAL